MLSDVNLHPYNKLSNAQQFLEKCRGMVRSAQHRIDENHAKHCCPNGWRQKCNPLWIAKAVLAKLAEIAMRVLLGLVQVMLKVGRAVQA